MFNVCFSVFGGMDISSMMSSINPEMLKDLTPEKIEDALKNLPPQMKDMMHSMGMSQHTLITAASLITVNIYDYHTFSIRGRYIDHCPPPH